MAGAIDTLQILIEADASGLTTQLKKAGDTIQSFVSQMNSQEVNWESILSKTISPAIITGIASMFALALEQSLSFTNALTTSSNNSSTAFQSNMGNAGQSALDLQAQTGQSANAIAQSMGSATKALGNYADGQAEVATASQFATATGQDLNSLVGELTPAMQEWGVTGASNISNTITELFGIAAQGKVSLQDLLTVMSNTGAFLKGKTSITEAASALESFSNQAGMTGATANVVFTQVAQNLSNAATAANNTVLGMGGYNKQLATIKSGGFGALLADMEQSLAKMGPSTASILLNHAGFSPVDTQNIVNADTSYKSIVPSTAAIATNSLAIGNTIKSNVSDMGKLSEAWGQFKSDVVSSGIADYFTGLVIDILKLVEGLTEGTIALLKLVSGVTMGQAISDLINGKPSDIIANANTQAEASVSSQYVTAKNKGDTTDASRLLALFQTMVASDAAQASGTSGASTSSTPAGTQTNNTTTHSVIINVTPAAVGGGKGVNSQSMATSLYAGQFGMQ